MKREFLKSLNLEADVIDKIMAQYGEDIEKYKNNTDELEAAKNNLKSKEKELEQLKKSASDIEALKSKIETLKNETQASSQKYQNEIKQMKISNIVDKALTNAKAKNNKVILPLLSEFLKDAKLDDKGEITGLKEQIEKLTQSNDTKFLFGETTEFKGIVPNRKTDSNFQQAIDQSTFDANKNDPNWINNNWESIATALKNKSIK